MSHQLKVEEYSEKAFVVRGDSKKYKEQLSSMHGKWNPRLTGGPGWIFSKKHMETVKKAVESINCDLYSDLSIVEPSPSPELIKKPRRRSIVKADPVRTRYENKIRRLIADELEEVIKSQLRSNYEKVQMNSDDTKPVPQTVPQPVPQTVPINLYQKLIPKSSLQRDIQDAFFVIIAIVFMLIITNLLPFPIEKVETVARLEAPKTIQKSWLDISWDAINYVLRWTFNINTSG